MKSIVSRSPVESTPPIFQILFHGAVKLYRERERDTGLLPNRRCEHRNTIATGQHFEIRHDGSLIRRLTIATEH
jgi:hypothetical protein